MSENTIQYSFRLNLSVPEHVMIHKALKNLDESLYKTKSAFIIDALDKYVKGVSPEALIDALSEKDYVTRDEFEDLKEDMIRLVTRNVTREVTKNMSSIFASAFSADNSVINIDCSQDDEYNR